jgi:hypothetical protein
MGLTSYNKKVNYKRKNPQITRLSDQLQEKRVLAEMIHLRRILIKIVINRPFGNMRMRQLD